MPIVAERWKPVVGFEGFYEVSNLGRVRSLPRNGTRKQGTILKPGIDKQGYRRVVLVVFGGKRWNKKIARLVAEAFIPNPKQKPEVNHKDTVKTNDVLSNLEWNTKPENVQHAYDNGLMNRFIGAEGSLHHMARLSTKDVKQIRDAYKGRGRGPSQETLGKRFGISQTMVGFIVRGENWKHALP